MSNFHTRVSIIILLIAFQSLCTCAFSQNINDSIPFKGYMYIQPNAGLSQYFGDYNDDDFYNKDPKFGYGGVLGYQVFPAFGIRAQFLKTELYGKKQATNEEFSSDIWDAALNLTLNINEIFSQYNSKRFLNLYLFSGAGITSYLSKVEETSTGNILNEHSTRQTEIFVPVGAGVALRLNDNISINLEYGDHITFKSNMLDFEDGEKNNDHYSYASLGIEIRFKSKDKDGDGVKDKDDQCPQIPGKIEMTGCPDIDNDGIADKDDACPDVAGKPEFKGCPDTDGDGIIDNEDACPEIAGKKELQGCPDKDNDGIADKDDKCPDFTGRKEFYGCPDRDGDAVIDIEDTCPDIKGLPEFAGCPDTDGDGIPDNKDNCPEVAGIEATNGCPEALKGALYEKIVYFDTDASVVLAKNIIDLNEIVAFSNEYPEATVSVVGHTDWKESDEYNMRLSEKRADYVIKYLKKKGMKNIHIEKSFFGKNKPIADNNTSEGMALNRRVEIRIYK